MAFLDNFKGKQYKSEVEKLQAEVNRLNSLLTPQMRDVSNMQMVIGNLQNQIAGLNNEIAQRKQYIAGQNQQVNNLNYQIATLNNTINAKNAEIFKLDEEIQMQDFGIYRPRFAFATSSAYKEKLSNLREQQKFMIKQGQAVTGYTNWTVNGNLKQGQKMVKDMQKLLLCAFNSECDELVDKVKYNNTDLLNKRNEIVSQLSGIDKSLKDIYYRETNNRAGYVYVISNIGSFGENVYKIGMTRRLEPMDRVDELGDASVPFNFDVHAMIFSNDAPALEAALHRAFENRKVNMVNTRREFFNVTLDEIEAEVKKNHDKTIEFTRYAPAEQYRESLKIKETYSNINK